MTVRAGYCSECGEDVWLREGGGCIRGHDPSSVVSARLIEMPSELDRFNWGAFFFPVLWPLVKGPAGWAGLFFGLGILIRFASDVAPKSWWVVGVVLGLGELGLMIWYARNANRLTWEKRQGNVDPAVLLKSSRTWGVVGAVITVALVVVSSLLLLAG